MQRTIFQKVFEYLELGLRTWEVRCESQEEQGRIFIDSGGQLRTLERINCEENIGDTSDIKLFSSIFGLYNPNIFNNDQVARKRLILECTNICITLLYC